MRRYGEILREEVHDMETKYALPKFNNPNAADRRMVWGLGIAGAVVTMMVVAVVVVAVGRQKAQEAQIAEYLHKKELALQEKLQEKAQPKVDADRAVAAEKIEKAPVKVAANVADEEETVAGQDTRSAKGSKNVARKSSRSHRGSRSRSRSVAATRGRSGADVDNGQRRMSGDALDKLLSGLK